MYVFWAKKLLHDNENFRTKWSGFFFENRLYFAESLQSILFGGVEFLNENKYLAKILPKEYYIIIKKK